MKGTGERSVGALKGIIGLLSGILVLAISLFTLGIAYEGGVRGVGLLGVWFLYTFGIIVVLAQLIPAGIFLFSFVKSHTSTMRREERPVPVA